MTAAKLRIIAIDDDPAFEDPLRLCCSELRMLTAELTFTAVVEDAATSVEAGEFDLVLLDYQLGATTGLEVIRRWREAGITVPIVVLTAQGHTHLAVELMRAGAQDYLAKFMLTPWTLEHAISTALRSHDVDEKLRGQRRELQDTLARLARSRDDLLAILGKLDVGSVLTDQWGSVAYVNAAAEALLGMGCAEAHERPWERLLATAPREAVASVAEMAGRLEAERARVAVTLDLGDDGTRHIEVDVRDDPRDAESKVLLLYDRTEVHAIRRELDQRARLGDMVGRSPAMQGVYQLIRDVAPYDASVLILGETGTGKELVARALHDYSPRRGGPFIAVNTAGLSDSLLASQLFGHLRGAFTGANENRKGLFEAADGGTIFLDEVGDMSAAVQTSLLRVLQEREVLPVGAAAARPVDVRVIAATHRDLLVEADAGRFRMDVMFRIRVATISLPALRDRREDIPLLSRHLLTAACAAMGKPVNGFSEHAMRVLLAHGWPGNVRELKSAIEFAVIRSRGRLIDTGDLPLEIDARSEEPGPMPEPVTRVASAAKASSAAAMSPQWPEQVRAALAQSGGNRAAAARLLGVSRATFYRREGHRDKA